MPLRSDIWRIGIVEAPIGTVATATGLADAPIHWLVQEPAFSFLADPFGIWRDGRLHIFAEAFDYRTRHGVIDVLTFDADLTLRTRRTVLREPWHLSYPFVVEADGETWMIPEAHRSGAVTLYRATAFPAGWEPVTRLELDTPAVDATPFRHDGLWWLAYSPSGSQDLKQGRLHLAYAEALTGPWRVHPGNPVRIDRGSSRPGGTPFLDDGVLTLPVQDCAATYGGAIRLLQIHDLTPERFAADVGPRLSPPATGAPYCDGLHTLSACGDVTLIDVKRIDHSPVGLAIDLMRRLGYWRA